MKTKAYRHGEIALVKVSEMPKNLKASESKIFMTGSHGNNHSFDNGKFYPVQDGTTFGYLKAKDTSLLHLVVKLVKDPTFVRVNLSNIYTGYTKNLEVMLV